MTLPKKIVLTAGVAMGVQLTLVMALNTMSAVAGKNYQPSTIS
jgi:hypothetical protein